MLDPFHDFKQPPWNLIFSYLLSAVLVDSARRQRSRKPAWRLGAHDGPSRGFDLHLRRSASRVFTVAEAKELKAVEKRRFQGLFRKPEERHVQKR